MIHYYGYFIERHWTDSVFVWTCILFDRFIGWSLYSFIWTFHNHWITWPSVACNTNLFSF